MSESELTELVKLYGKLQELNAKIDHLTMLFNQAAHGEGFPRCAKHSVRLKHVEDGVELCHARIGVVKKWLLAGLVGLASTLANFAWNILQAHIKR